MNDLDFYRAQGRISDPGRHAAALGGLPEGVAALCEIARNATVHVFWAERYGLALSSERRAEVNLRTAELRLGRTLELDHRPILEARPLERRLVGNCRDFSLLLVSLLRHSGAPARARCGFGTYFRPGQFEDHWVAEYWNPAESRWVLADAQLDDVQREALGIDFDPLDVPRDRFVSGGDAWRMCRSGRADPEAFGIFDMRGLGFVRGNCVRDLAALNKVELLPWDCWGLILAPSLDDPSDLSLLDRLAELSAGEAPDTDGLRDLYESDPRLTVGSSVQSFVDGSLRTVGLPA